ncbi:hypothetical protein Tco_0362770 [Tanacetum coccineum]
MSASSLSSKFEILRELPKEKVNVITALKNNLSKLKGKNTVDNAAQMSDATIMAPGMYKLDQIILAPRVKNNMETHEYYLKHTMEQADILREGLKEKPSTRAYSVSKPFRQYKDDRNLSGEQPSSK